MEATKEKLNIIEKYCRKEIARLGISRVIATVSGGADSIALLSALSATGAETIALHCNFHLRGEESMRDQRHVEEICRKLSVELHVMDFDVDSYIEANPGTSVEMACRSLRYDWFRQQASVLHVDRIATGHNADDNIETLFLNLLRGSGTSGLKGINPDSGKIWRPLLKFHRPEIEDYLHEKRLSFITDSSNLSNDYRRNYLRNEIIPRLRSQWKGFDKSLDRSISHLRSENAVVNAMVDGTLPPEGEPLSTCSILKFPAPELIVRRFIEPAGPFTTTSSEIIEAIKADKPDRKIWNLKRGTITLCNRKLTVIQNKKLI